MTDKTDLITEQEFTVRRSQLPLIIAARQSELSQTQAKWVGERLQKLNPGLEVDYKWVQSEADRRQDVALAKIGGKGLFVRAVEAMLLNQQADLAVHSMKDLPTDEMSPAGLTVVAIPPRVDNRDCLISRTHANAIIDLPDGAVLGTSAPRRAAQIKRIRPDIDIQLLRGNIQTRLRKVELGEVAPNGKPYDATLLAAAGLLRSGLKPNGARVLSISEVLPAASQGALALQARGDDSITLKRCLLLNHAASAQTVELERELITLLKGDCYSPIAAVASVQLDDKGHAKSYKLTARVISPDGNQLAEATEEIRFKERGLLPKMVADGLLRQGAREILNAANPQRRLGSK